ncbi:hypothetical protein CDO52_25655 [Nocardiopsis gilva YIM 90087]|uniref:DUF4232 domain-containing protein n=1 Tax=Nocardiopsis gilva YIM 90087 TaxID=1235441 RepID=A0A223SCB3_9ACTN|nr:hypothetical protein CDO52_25655 [Nocardiopsis gilva YIM 90087]
MFVLAGLLLVVALIAYACSRPSSSNEDQAAAEADASPSPQAPSSPSVSPKPAPDRSASPNPSAGEGAKGGGADGDEGSAAAGSGSGRSKGSGGSEGAKSVPVPTKASDPCRPQDVVVTFEVDKSDYAWDGKPKIEITAVNTGEQTCTVDMGPKNMEVLIKSGDDRVFSTADCAKGDKAVVKKKLERGVPRSRTVTWDRKRSWKECRDADVDARRPGTYVATLESDYDEGAERQVFRLN